MQKIAYTIFEIAKQGLAQQIPQDQLLQAVEHHVVKVYKQSIEELEQKGVIDEETKNRAESQSNIDQMAQQAQAEHARQAELEKQAQSSEANRQNDKEARRKRREEARAKRQLQKNGGNVSTPQGITNKDLKLMSLALLLKILSQDKVTTILNKFDSNDSLVISQYMNMADLESKLDGDLVTDCLKEMKDFIPTKRKLTKENLINALRYVYSKYPREHVEKIIKNERPLVKRFASQAYDGEYSELPLRVAGIITEYIEESIK